MTQKNGVSICKKLESPLLTPEVIATLGVSRCRTRERGRSGGSGPEAGSPSPPPRRPARARFPAGRARRWTGRDAWSVSLTRTGRVAPGAVLACIAAPGMDRAAVLAGDRLSLAPGLSPPRTWPPRGVGSRLAPAAGGHAWTTPRTAPARPRPSPGRRLRAGVAWSRQLAAPGAGRPPVAAAAASRAPALPPVGGARGAVRPDGVVAAGEPPRWWLARPAVRPAPPRAPAVVSRVRDGRLPDRMALGHGPRADARGRVAPHGCGRDGLGVRQP